MGTEKGLSKECLLGLCEEGYVQGIPKGMYNTRRNSKNKNYAIKATEIIKEQPELLEDIKELWYRVSNGSGMSHNHQMEVVRALYKKNYIHD